ncbi:MAG: hypothetical protein QOE45_1821, partial [Frankiaceae bacterium]|nr:hypothetical protein [Frankiaceae bacterium]
AVADAVGSELGGAPPRRGRRR